MSVSSCRRSTTAIDTCGDGLRRANLGWDGAGQGIKRSADSLPGAHADQVATGFLPEPWPHRRWCHVKSRLHPESPAQIPQHVTCRPQLFSRLSPGSSRRGSRGGQQEGEAGRWQGLHKHSWQHQRPTPPCSFRGKYTRPASRLVPRLCLFQQQLQIGLADGALGLSLCMAA